MLIVTSKLGGNRSNTGPPLRKILTYFCSDLVQASTLINEKIETLIICLDDVVLAMLFDVQSLYSLAETANVTHIVPADKQG